MDTRKLTKLMMLTTSDNDHEALIALRMANKLIKIHQTSWEQVLASKVDMKPKAEAVDERYAEAVAMLAYIYDNAPAWFDQAFTDSLQQQLYAKKRLSPKQFSSLVKIYQMLKKQRS